MLINTTADFAAVAPEAADQATAFLNALLNDYVVFDDAEYPEEYDRMLQPDDDGYIAPVIRQEWNAGAAAAWGFNSRAAIQAALGGK